LMMHLRNPDRQQAGSYTGPSASPTVNGYIAFFFGGASVTCCAELLFAI
jgi:hypothetical protein